MADDALLKIEADVSQAIKETSRFADESSKSLSKIEKAFGGLGKVALAAVAAFSVKKIGEFFGAAIEAAAEAEVAVNDLNTALQLTGIYSEDTSKGLQDLASSLQDTTIYSDDAITSATALLQNIARLDSQGLQRAVIGATNLAAALNIDLNTAFSMVGKALAGNTGALSRYGVAVSKGATESQTFANVMQALEKFQGAAEAKTKTFAGAMEQLKNVYGDVFEELGKVIIENRTFIEVINGSAQAISDVIKFLKTMIEAFSKLDPILIGLTGTIIAASVALNTLTAASFSAMLANVWAMATAFGAAAISVGALAAQIGAVAAGFAVTAWSVELVIRNVGNLKELFTAMISYVAGGLGIIAESLARLAGMESFANNIAAKIDNLAATAAEAGEVIDTGFGGKALDSIKDFFGTFSKGTKANADASTSAQKSYADLQNAAKASAKGQQEAARRILYPLEDLVKAEQAVRKEINERGKSAEDLIQIELDRAREMAALTEFELAAQGKLDAQAQKLIDSYLAAAEAKAAFAMVDINAGKEEAEREALKQERDKKLEEQQYQIQLAVDTFQNITSAISDGVSAGVDIMSAVFVDFFSGAFINQLADGLFAVLNAPKAFIEALSNLDGMLGQMLEDLDKGLFRVVDRIPELLSSVLQRLPILISKIFGTVLPKMAKTLARVLPGLVDSLLKMVPKIFAQIPKILKPLIKAIPAIVWAILKNLPDIIRSGLLMIGEVIAEIVKVLPDVLVSILDNLDEIILALVEGFAAASSVIIEALIDSLLIEGGLERIIKALILAMPRIAQALVVGMYHAMLTIVGAVGDGIARGFREAMKDWWIPARIVNPEWLNALRIPTPEWMDPFIKAIREFVNFSPGGVLTNAASGGGIVPDWVPVVGGYATGGVVPGGFANDSFPARLTSGEMIIPRGDVDRLSAFLDKAERERGVSVQPSQPGNNGPINVVLKVGERELSRVLIDLNRLGYRTA